MPPNARKLGEIRGQGSVWALPENTTNVVIYLRDAPHALHVPGATHWEFERVAATNDVWLVVYHFQNNGNLVRDAQFRPSDVYGIARSRSELVEAP